MSEYDNVICSSFGNDSVALIQWASENLTSHRVAVVYNNTGWHSEEWEKRIATGKKWVESLGFDFIETHYENNHGKGFEALVRKYNKFPNTRRKWCTGFLKTKPTLEWLEMVDPDKEVVIMTGVRREESARRSTHAEWIDEDPRYKGRDMWCPLVMVKEFDRDRLIAKTPFLMPLPHRSMECSPCIYANKSNEDYKHVSAKKVKVIFKMEQDLTKINEEPAYMFHPTRCQGAKNINEWLEWAKAPRGKYDRTQPSLFDDCGSGECGI